MFFMELDKSDEENPKVIATSPLTAGELNQRPLSEYVPIDQPIESQNIDYLRGQLDFLTNLCKGNNKLAIDMLKKKFSFEVLFSGLTDENIHPEIRSKFAQLLSAMYIDVGQTGRFWKTLHLHSYSKNAGVILRIVNLMKKL